MPIGLLATEKNDEKVHQQSHLIEMPMQGTAEKYTGLRMSLYRPHKVSRRQSSSDVLKRICVQSKILKTKHLTTGLQKVC